MDSEKVEVLEIELLLWLTPLEFTEDLERWHLWNLEFWHSILHFLILKGSGFLELGFVLMDFLFELFSGYVVEFLWVPGLFETVDHDTGGGEILDNVGDFLDSLLIRGALVVLHHHGEKFVTNTNEIHSVFFDSIPDFTVFHETGVKVIHAPVLPDITDFLHLASLVVLVDTINEHVNGLLHLSGGDTIIVFMEHLDSGIDALVSWLQPVTEALFGDWIILLVVHTSDRLDIGFLHDLSDDCMEWEEFLLWDLAIFGLVESMVL